MDWSSALEIGTPWSAPPPLGSLWGACAALAALLVLSGLIGLVGSLAVARERQRRAKAREQVWARLVPYLTGREGLLLAAADLLEEFGRAPVAEVLRGLRREIDGPILERVAAALEVLGETGRHRRRARSRWRSTRLDAVAALGDCGGPAAVEALRELLAHEQLRTRREARLALLRCGDARALEQVYASFVQDVQAPRKEDAGFVWRLARRRPELLLESLRRGEFPSEHRALALDVLGEAGVAGALALLPSALADGHAEVRAAAARVAGRLRHWQSRPALIRLLDDPIWFVRACAAAALGRLPLDDGVGPLADVLSDPRRWVRRNAARGLARHGVAGIGALLRALHERGVAGEAARLALFDVDALEPHAPTRPAERSAS